MSLSRYKIALEVCIHILIWALVFYITYSNFGVRLKLYHSEGLFQHALEFSSTFFIMVCVDLLIKIGLFYTAAFYLWPLWLKKHRNTKILIIIVLLFILTALLSLGLNRSIFYAYADTRMHKTAALIAYSLGLHLVVLLMALGYRLSKDWASNEVMKKQLLQDKLESELHFLKAQIHPHFLFNTLNNLYAEARSFEPPTVANGIAKLSHMMRYMIYESNVTQISLDKELQYIDSYIALQKLRIATSDPVEIEFHKDISNTTCTIAPMLFIPFVENAFKYGINIEAHSFIHILLKTEGNTLYFEVCNSLWPQSGISETASGFGLKNVKRRLSLLYPDRHDLDISSTETEFKIVLTLQIAAPHDA